jgi:hypothetical protein
MGAGTATAAAPSGSVGHMGRRRAGVRVLSGGNPNRDRSFAPSDLVRGSLQRGRPLQCQLRADLARRCPHEHGSLHLDREHSYLPLHSGEPRVHFLRHAGQRRRLQISRVRGRCVGTILPTLPSSGRPRRLRRLEAVAHVKRWASSEAAVEIDPGNQASRDVSRTARLYPSAASMRRRRGGLIPLMREQGELHHAKHT